MNFLSRQRTPQWHRTELNTLYHVAVIALEATDSEDLTVQVTETLIECFDPNNVGFLFLDADSHSQSERAPGLRIHSSYHGLPADAYEREVQLGQGVTGTVAQTGRPLLIPDVSHDSRYIEAMPTVRAELCAPVCVGAKVVGVINVEDEEVASFSERELHLLSIIAEHTGTALLKLRRYRSARRRASTDGLTRVYNRRYFYRRLEEELERSRRYGPPCALIMLDVDDFKMYNDRYGHLAGDDLLRELASLLKDAVRQVDIVARYGGDEFAMILPETDVHQGSSVAERLRQTVSSHAFALREAEQDAHITLSVGVAAFPTHATEVEALVDAADRALLAAKREKATVRQASTEG